MSTARKPRTPKSSADLKAKLIQKKKELEELEKRAYAEELSEAIKATNIVDEFAKIKANTPNINDAVLIEAIATEAGIKRITVTQAAPAKRKTSNKPRKSKKAE